MLSRIPWLRLMVMAVGLGLGLGTAALAAGAGTGSTPAVELHLDTLENTTTSPDGTTPMGTTPDSSGNGLNATASGTPISDGRFQGALSMSYDDNGVTVPDNTLLQPAAGVTVMAWVRDSANPGDNRMILGKPFSDGCQRLSYGLITGPTGGLEFDTTTYNDGEFEQATSEADPATLWDGHWHAIAGTYDGSTMKLWIDGVQKETLAVGNQPLSYNTGDPSHTGLYAGLPTAPTGCDYSSYRYGGQIDEIRVYGRALTQSEIQTLQSSAATAPPELTTTTTTPTTTPTGPPPPPTIHLSTTLPANGKGLIVDASHTTGASKFVWGLGAKGTTIFQGGPGSSVLKLTEPHTLTLPIKFTAFAPSGASSSKTITATIPGLGVSSKFTSGVAAFAANPQLLIQAAQTVAALNNCSQMDVIANLVDARGCFAHITSTDLIPPREKQTVLNYYSNPTLPLTLQLQCSPSAIKNQIKQRFCNQQTADFKALDIYVSKGPVKLNGTTFTPSSTAAVVVYPNQKRLICAECTAAVGPFTFKHNDPIDFDLSNVSSPGSIGNGETGSLFTFDASKDVPVIGGFPIDAGAQLAFGATNGVYRTDVTLHVGLPKTFDAFGSGTQPSASAVASATNDRDLYLGTLDISVPHASLGGVGFDNVAFHYSDAGEGPPVDCPAKYWHATGNITLGEGVGGQPAGGFYLTPPPDENGIAFCQGDFKSVGLKVIFNPPLFPTKPELFPGLFLDNINGALSLNPTMIRAGFRVDAGDIYYVDGVGLIVFASQDNPYYLTAADEGAALSGLGPRKFTSTAIAAGGDVGINFDGQDLNLGNIGAMYSFPDYIAIGGGVDIYLGVFRAYGGISGDANLRTREFQLTVDGHVCITGFESGACIGGEGIVSSQGIVACLDLKAFGAEIHPGIGVHPPGSSSAHKYGLIEQWLIPPDGCKPSHFWVAVTGRSSAAGHASAALSFRVARGETAKSLALAGVGGAPKIVVTGPGAQRYVLDADGLTRQGPLIGDRSDYYDTTWFGLDHGKPGTYTITPLPGSVPFGTLRETRPGYDTNFTAHVTGRGNHRVLHYDARKRGGGQRVSFYEQGLNVFHRITVSTGGKGKVRFTPAIGSRGTRTIVAEATVDGVPIQRQTLARFFFAGTPRTGRPGRVRVRRAGRMLIITWTSAVGAVRYGVLVNRTDGSQQRYVLSAKRHRLRIRLPLTDGAAVTVSARGVFGDWGAARRARFLRARKASFSVFLAPRKHRR